MGACLRVQWRMLQACRDICERRGTGTRYYDCALWVTSGCGCGRWWGTILASALVRTDQRQQRRGRVYYKLTCIHEKSAVRESQGIRAHSHVVSPGLRSGANISSHGDRGVECKVARERSSLCNSHTHPALAIYGPKGMDQERP